MMAASQPYLPEDRFHDRELSWLAFNHRVLDMAEHPHIPLVERARFLGIASRNLDEFFMVRVGGLKRRLAAGVAVASASGILPHDLHALVLEGVRRMMERQARIFQEDVRPRLAEAGLEIITWDDLTDAEVSRAHHLFAERIDPILTPLAVDPAHPFPYVSGLVVNLAVLLRHPETGSETFARIKVPSNMPRFVQVAPSRYLPVESLIGNHLTSLFTGMEVLEWSTFRVTRNEDIEVEEDDAENILLAIEKELLHRRVGRPAVRVEVQDDMSEGLTRLLIDRLDVLDAEVIRLPWPLDLGGLLDTDPEGHEELEFRGFLPRTHPALAEVETAKPADLFDALHRGDVLLHHPYDSFATSVQRFVEQAAADPKVLAIKQTLYRTSGDSPLVDALIEAAHAGKQVLVVVELMARFDERNNIHWARKLERAGCHVVYGILGQKTHAKLCLVVRDEGPTLKRYVHIGTGNYNPRTARSYEDMGLLTANPVVCEDVARVFNHLSGMTREANYRRLVVAPEGVRMALLHSIQREIDNARAGRPSGIRIKVNGLVDETCIDALYRASQAGVPVDLWVRGICALRAGVPGLSDNVRVRSILGRFLEHSRLYWFSNGGEPLVALGSADLMHRNLDRRVEVLVPLAQPEHRREVERLFDLAFDEGTITWHLHDNDWTLVAEDSDGRLLTDLQERLMDEVDHARKADVR